MDEIRPQPGPQEEFCSCSADIAFIGGGNFGGKTTGAILDSLYHVEVPGFEAVFFRRIMPEITNPGGLWDQARKLYSPLGANLLTSPRHQATFGSGARVTFAQMQYEDDRYSWDGSEIAGIYFDQLEQFTEKQFWYMLTRNRSQCGVKPYMRATYNPRPGNWLMALIQWYWDAETGYPIQARSGVIRWFVRKDDVLYWADSSEDLRHLIDETTGESLPAKSFTVIFASAYDNKIGIKNNPDYIPNLLAQPLPEMERRLKGNHKIEDVTGDGLFKPEWWKILSLETWQAIQEAPVANFKWARGWDPAGGQSKGSDFSSGGLVGHPKDRDKDKRIIIADITRGQWSPGVRNTMIAATASRDLKFETMNYFWKSRTPDMNRSISEDEEISKYGFWAIAERGRKFQRAQRLAVQAEARNVWLAPGPWNAEFILEAAQFKDEDSDEVRKDDQVDCVCLSDSQLIKWG